jgi:preprotein translocase subunit Sss1
MGAIYELIGRAVVRLAWWRFGTQMKIAGAVGLLAVGLLGYLVAKREPPEG